VPSSSGAEESDQQREAEGYNYSIYLMVGMPYLLLGAVGLFVYRGMHRKPSPPPESGRAPNVSLPPPTGANPASSLGEEDRLK
jgi:hypothetical protein